MTYTIWCWPPDWPWRVAAWAWRRVEELFVLAPWWYFIVVEGYKDFL